MTTGQNGQPEFTKGRRIEQGQHRPPAASTQVIVCPWHKHTEDGIHPGGAPECTLLPGALAIGRVIPLGDLVTWIALAMAEVMMVTNAIIEAAGLSFVSGEEASVEAAEVEADRLEESGIAADADVAEEE